MSYYALGPVKPKKKPRPKPIKFEGGNIAFIDAEDSFAPLTPIYVCLNEDSGIMGGLESGTYTTLAGEVVTVIDGIIDEIAS